MTKNDLVGHQLDEYLLEDLLGYDGVVHVYRAADVRLGRHAVVKVIDAPHRDYAAYWARFERVAQAIARLEHSNIARLYRYGQVGDLLYMATQYVEGTDLDSVLEGYRQEDRLIKPADARRIIREVCQALDYAHGNGVIHRDVKPSSILLDKEGRVLITDFGLALLVEVGTQGEISGPSHHLAPEQVIASADASPQSDLYSVGAILYEMFTGAAITHLADPLPQPREIRPEIGLALESMILRALAKDPQDRYPDGAALADALDHALMRAATTVVSRPTEFDKEQPELQPPQPSPPAEETRIAEQTEQRIAHVPEADTPTRKRRSPLIALVVIGALLGCVAWMALAGVLLLPGLLGSRAEQAAVTIGDEATATYTAAPGGSVLSPVPSQTPEPPTAAPSPTDTPTPTPVESYRIRLAKNKDESMFVINRSEAPFPLPRLGFGSKRGPLSGKEWNIEWLASGECVAVWSAEGNPASPDVDCTLAEGAYNVERSGRLKFWREDFDIYFDERWVGSCSHKKAVCDITIRP